MKSRIIQTDSTYNKYRKAMYSFIKFLKNNASNLDDLFNIGYIVTLKDSLINFLGNNKLGRIIDIITIENKKYFKVKFKDETMVTTSENLELVDTDGIIEVAYYNTDLTKLDVASMDEDGKINFGKYLIKN